MQSKAVIQATLLFTSSLTIMANATMAPNLPVIEAAFSQTPHAEFLTKLILTFPALIIVLGAPFAGWVVDRLGRKKIMAIAVVIYGLAGCSGGLLNSLTAILISRAVLGLAVAITMTVSTTLIGDYFTGEERTRLMSKQGAFMALGGVIYISLAGFLADSHWRYPFFIYISSFIALIPILKTFYEPEVSGSKNSSDQDRHPPVPRAARVIYITSFIGMTFFYFVPVQIPFLIQKVSETSNTITGLAISASMVTGAVVSFLYYRIKQVIPRFPTLFAVTFTALALGYLIISMANTLPVIITGLILAGTGMGILLPNTNLWMLSIAPEAIRGRLTGGITTAVFLGQFISPLVSEPLKNNFSPSGMYTTASVCVGMLALAYWAESFWSWRKAQQSH